MWYLVIRLRLLLFIKWPEDSSLRMTLCSLLWPVAISTIRLQHMCFKWLRTSQSLSFKTLFKPPTILSLNDRNLCYPHNLVTRSESMKIRGKERIIRTFYASWKWLVCFTSYSHYGLMMWLRNNFLKWILSENSVFHFVDEMFYFLYTFSITH